MPVTLVNAKKRSAEHAEYAGSVLFKNVFEGELPAAEYPKIGVSSFVKGFRLRADRVNAVLWILERRLCLVGCWMGLPVLPESKGTTVSILRCETLRWADIFFSGRCR